MLLHHQFVLAAKSRGHHPAIVDGTLGLRLSYRQALVRALALSRRLQALPPGFVGVMLPNTAGTVVTIVAALLAGRIPVMINYATGAAANCRTAREICRFTTVLTSRAFCDKIGCPHLDGFLYVEDLKEQISAAEGVLALMRAFLPARVLLASVHGGEPDDTALVLFTSGSEKEPKAVELTHRNIWTNCGSLAQAFGLRSDDLILANLPYFHVFGQTGNLWLPVACGITLVTVADPLDFRAICSLIRREGVTLVTGTPTLLWGLLRASRPGDFQSCRILFSGADRCPEPLRNSFRERHGLEICEAYGATETSPAVSANTPRFNRPGSAGRLLGGVQVKIRDIESDAACGPGESGRILVKGDTVMKGYFGDPAATALVLRDGWYDTGDVGYLDEDGFLWLTGRLRRFVKVGGEMVSLVRVEEALDAVLPADAESCVVELPHPFRGSQIVAVTTRSVDETATQEELAKVLPMIALPSRFVVVGELPKAASGKVDFRGATELARAALGA